MRFLAVVGSLSLVLVIYSLAIRPWLLTWGASPAEIAATDPTDRLVAPPIEVGSTRAITIDAPASAVWPWLAQVGQGRGGFYSYDILENALFHCEIHSTDRIISTLTHPKTGDAFRFCQEGPPMTRTHLYVESGRAIAYSPGWAFTLAPLNPTQTRLVARWRAPRAAALGSIGDFIVWDVVLDTVHFVMERKMLEGIKQRAEGVRATSIAADDTQVFLWTIAFLVMVMSTVAVFFGPTSWRQLALAWAAAAHWMFLMFVQPSIALGIPLSLVLLAVAAIVFRWALRSRHHISKTAIT